MSGPVAGRAVLVTGAAGGIGRAAALEAAARGAAVVITDIQAEPLAMTADEIGRRGGRVLHGEPLDLTDHEAVQSFATAVHDAHGSVDVVMNVAGTSTWGAVDRLTHEHWRSMVEVDLMGPINVIEAFVPAMMAAGRGGHLVNVSSSAGLIGLPWHAAYSAAKFGLRGVSEVLRFDLEPYGIGVSLVCPGAVDTPLVDTVEIVGVDRGHPAVRKLTERFRRHAVSAERVGELILDAVERGRYLVLTSRDIRALVALQSLCPPLYRLVMRRLNRELTAVGEQARLPDRPSQ
jgi:NAD(P)-dependent dehydrogenase (short-subunit alcohol dehydrogenase family)